MDYLNNIGLPKQVIDLLSSPSGSNELHLVLRNFGSGYTAIRDDDLPLARQVSLMVVSFFGSSILSWAPTTVAGLILFLIDIRKKGIQVSAIQGAVLKELRSNPGLTTQQIAAGLKLNKEEVAETLASLQLITNVNKRLTPLVEERDEQKWYTLDV